MIDVSHLVNIDNPEREDVSFSCFCGKRVLGDWNFRTISSNEIEYACECGKVFRFRKEYRAYLIGGTIREGDLK